MTVMEQLGVLGGTGPLGRGLALRLAQAGHRVLIGSRSAERAAEAVAKIREKDATIDVAGVENAEAARAELVVVAVPFEGLEATLAPLAGDVGGKVVVSCVTGLVFDDAGPGLELLDAGSAAEAIQELWPAARVVGAWQTVAAGKLLRAPDPVEVDVPLVGDDEEAREQVATLVERIPGMRAVHAGPLRLARPIEEFSAVLAEINRRYRVRSGVRIAGLEE